MSTTINTTSELRPVVKDTRSTYKRCNDMAAESIRYGKIVAHRNTLDPSKGRPRNPISEKLFYGAPLHMVLAAMGANSFTDPRFVTYQQAKTVQGYVKAKPASWPEERFYYVPVPTWNPDETWEYTYRDDATGEMVTKTQQGGYRLNRVFNVTRCAQIAFADPSTWHQLEYPAPTMDEILASYPNPPRIIARPDIAGTVYDEVEDVIYTSEVTRDQDLLAALVQSTGGPGRLNRPSAQSSETWALVQEEFVVDFAVTILLMTLRRTRDDAQDAGALALWADVFADPQHEKLALRGANQAQKAVNFILGQEVTVY